MFSAHRANFSIQMCTHRHYRPVIRGLCAVYGSAENGGPENAGPEIEGPSTIAASLCS